MGKDLQSPMVGVESWILVPGVLRLIIGPGGTLSAPSLPLAGGGGRDRKGCGTTWDNFWIECFWPLAVSGVVSATGICTGSQPNPPVTTRSHLVPCQLAPHHLVPHHQAPHHPMILCHLLPHQSDPPPRTLLPFLAHRWVPGRVTIWRYVGSTCQLGEEGSFMWGLQLGREDSGARRGPLASGIQMGPFWDSDSHLGSPAT